MRLEEIVTLLGGVELRTATESGGGLPRVADLAYDSREATTGSLFFCLPGSRDDGHRYAEQAVAGGAVALVCERPVLAGVPQLIVPHARAAMNRLASPFFGRPSRRIRLVGVTGTNGKTTSVYLLESILRAAGERAGLIGTIEARVAGEVTPGPRARRTTPESVDLQRLLARMVDAGVTSSALEVTSIGLAQGRVEGTYFQVAAFTNLTQDHLDYHHDIERYYQAKRSLFTSDMCKCALINVDDPNGRRLAGEVEVPSVTFGIDSSADIEAHDVRSGRGGSSFRAVGMGLDRHLRIHLPGRFNLANALVAAGAAALLRVPQDAIVRGLEAVEVVPGRFQVVGNGQPFPVIVDYAHTPDGLARVLSAAAEMAGGPRPSITSSSGRILVVFGCGGDRDRGKRPLMGEAAGRHADLVFITSDNPRSESPLEIIAEIEEGLASAPPPLGYHKVPDREEAIRRAIFEAGPGDVVVIAGKGHETYQEIAGRSIAFDDRLVAERCLEMVTGERP
ncbi:MAG: UDP-N-acetylmuramoyl-L-alanyl-D-glutamate--2,6-diaminopimelate ligase [Actinomycetota bacterium]